jgi:hypothetical protein
MSTMSGLQRQLSGGKARMCPACEAEIQKGFKRHMAAHVHRGDVIQEGNRCLPKQKETA